jgi:hypothetical protein
VCRETQLLSPKGGISPYYSPRKILHQQSNIQNIVQFLFGSYVQAHIEPDPKITQHPCKLDCIYLRYVDNNQGGHHLLDLHMGRTIKRCTMTTIPITTNIIDLVHKMADNDNMSDGLKIETKSGLILYDSAWIARVDYQENDDI